jgi:hypothetical protein
MWRTIPGPSILSSLETTSVFSVGHLWEEQLYYAGLSALCRTSIYTLASISLWLLKTTPHISKHCPLFMWAVMLILYNHSLTLFNPSPAIAAL